MKYLGNPQSGSQAGTTASRNRFGQYLRTRAIPVNPDTPSQGLVRNRFATLTQAWQSLTAGQRALWADYAATHPVTDPLGQVITLTALNWYVRVNTVMIQAGQSQVSVPPGPHNFSNMNPVLEANWNTTTMLASMTILGDPAQPAGVRFLLQSTGLLSPAVNFGQNYKFVSNGTADDWDQGANILPGFEALYGPISAASVGQKIIARVKIVDTIGNASAYETVSAIVAQTA